MKKYVRKCDGATSCRQARKKCNHQHIHDTIIENASGRLFFYRTRAEAPRGRWWIDIFSTTMFLTTRPFSWDPTRTDSYLRCQHMLAHTAELSVLPDQIRLSISSSDRHGAKVRELCLKYLVEDRVSGLEEVINPIRWRPARDALGAGSCYVVRI